ncbi:MAG: DNA gyrase/topoisomerase IV subunit A [Tannerella sp.]|nr:DNA gyrase/topoisomerase IV subunit A [Tannerella sp.]
MTEEEEIEKELNVSEENFEDETDSDNETDSNSDNETDSEVASRSNYHVPGMGDSSNHLGGMYKNWFLDYSSYVILDRAVPHINDGLKPVQRRILHAMRQHDDGRYNKVAAIVGDTMHYHPHGDASIGAALVNLGQKDLLIDCQGNWGNILTGDDAAAPRYIEARLSKFALETVFNPKTTIWKLSYDGRNREPVSLPVKFPLLLTQGGEGIAVGLASKILPHNFNEIIDAAIACLKGEEFVLYPDFQTGGYIDVAGYKDGKRSGVVKVRAKINKLDNKALVITEIPFGTNTGTLTESIIKASEKGKIKIRKVDNLTAQNAEIVVYLQPGISSDKTIDALYACTDCEIKIYPNCCVIIDNKPYFLGVSDVLKHSTDQTLNLLRQELEIFRAEQEEQLLFASLERIFITERIYKDKEFEEAADINVAIAHIDSRLEPYKPTFIREITRDDILRLMEIKMGRILKFNVESNDELIARIKDEIEKADYKLAHIVEVTIEWFNNLKTKYGSNFPRKTEIRNFDTIEATKVVEANQKLYINREDGFIGTSLKKDEYVCDCSDIDDVIIFYETGIYKIIKVSDKFFAGKKILHIDIFRRNDSRTIYNTVYRDGTLGKCFIKRFNVTGITRDREYDLTQGTPGSKVLYFSANPNGEAETVKVVLKPKLLQRTTVIEKDFSEVLIKGRNSMGNVLTRYEVHKILLKQKGSSTLGGRQVWFDSDVLRLNYDGRGKALGEFFGDDKIIVIMPDGNYYTTDYDLSNHYEDNILRIEKFDPNKVWTVALYDGENKFPYLKRFQLEESAKRQNFLGDNNANKLYLLTDTVYPRLEVVFGGNDAYRTAFEIDAEQFIGVKGFKAKGKRISTFNVETVNELEPLRLPPNIEEPEPEPQNDSPSNAHPQPVQMEIF